MPTKSSPAAEPPAKSSSTPPLPKTNSLVANLQNKAPPPANLPRKASSTAQMAGSSPRAGPWTALKMGPWALDTQRITSHFGLRGVRNYNFLKELAKFAEVQPDFGIAWPLLQAAQQARKIDANSDKGVSHLKTVEWSLNDAKGAMEEHRISAISNAQISFGETAAQSPPDHINRQDSVNREDQSDGYSAHPRKKARKVSFIAPTASMSAGRDQGTSSNPEAGSDNGVANRQDTSSDQILEGTITSDSELSYGQMFQEPAPEDVAVKYDDSCILLPADAPIGWPHLIDLSTLSANDATGLHIADMVVTILFKHSLSTLERFMDMKYDFTFHTRSGKGMPDFDFLIVRTGTIVTCGLKDQNRGHWDLKHVYRLRGTPMARWTGLYCRIYTEPKETDILEIMGLGEGFALSMLIGQKWTAPAGGKIVVKNHATFT